jgi:hypothetical protein
VLQNFPAKLCRFVVAALVQGVERALEVVVHKLAHEENPALIIRVPFRP